MTLPEFFLRYDDVRTQTLQTFASSLRDTAKKCVGDVTLNELSAASEYPNGLYFFFDEDDRLEYVGKSSSRSFIERVPSHFDPRLDGWFNTLPKKLMKHDGFALYAPAHARALELRLVLLGVGKPGLVGTLEGVLRSYLQPRLNAGRQGRYPGSRLLAASEA